MGTSGMVEMLTMNGRGDGVSGEGLGGIKTHQKVFHLRAVLVHLSFNEHVMRQQVGYVGLQTCLVTPICVVKKL